MTIFILDLDWLCDKSEIPNVNCMRLSSFHKQRKDSVYLVGDMSDLTMQYDRLYIWSDSDSTPTPGHRILNDPRTVLFGKRFMLCGAKQLGTVILGCRPDYLLYDITNEKSSSYSKANFITFFSSNGDKVISRQAWHNTKKGVKRTIVTDELLWKQDPVEITMCLSEIIDEPNVVFLQPISLKCLVENESVRNAFFALKFSRGTQFKWRNDVGQDEQSAQKIVELLLELKKHTKSAIAPVPFQVHLNTTWQDDVKRILQIAAIFKKNKLSCSVPTVTEQDSQIYKWIKQWLEKYIDTSFIEYMCFYSFAKKGLRWFNIINDRTHWVETKTRFIIQMLAEEQWKECLPQLCLQWGNNEIDARCIDFTTVEKYAKMII